MFPMTGRILKVLRKIKRKIKGRYGWKAIGENNAPYVHQQNHRKRPCTFRSFDAVLSTFNWCTSEGEFSGCWITVFSYTNSYAKFKINRWTTSYRPFCMFDHTGKLYDSLAGKASAGFTDTCGVIL